MEPLARQYDDVWLVIPVYNEETVIQAVVKDAMTVFPHVVCVDDGSPDGSASAIAASEAHLVRHPINLGQGAALQTGIAYARARAGARYFVTFDADGQHRVEDAAEMVELARTGAADVVLGSRFLDEDTSSVPWVKRIVLRVVAALSPAARRLKLTDAHNGLRVLTRPVADDLRITMNGMAHASQIVSYLARSDWRVAEHPVTIRYTDYSRSKGQSLVNGVNILFDLGVRQRGA
ncbi:glycosyltransferase family 2 protein [Pseudonocardia abyssalis]|uniref:Glycosyltransferase family 2 protein n=1 Tax=Pseudonocardia abyssalis TaxID=2792008 RepID=A0ABS6UXZ3_9PSEU|nr:glycosyltransferase family 2 protein [Pseudonocardia abyssalis]MBW0115002.1 glycosyltransferase family 2 protein [Pseudonocardia abyssalis]MBW0137125.1 glycosyltransferase family 2 protein [Pseudonocardia abyssalis]